MDNSLLREKMVVQQLVPRGISSQRVLDIFRSVKRHKFVPDKLRDIAYSDYPLPIGEGQTISQPFIVALMTERLSLKGDEKVLEIGTGSGYQLAILSRLSRDVYSVERFSSLARKAGRTLADLGYMNVYIDIGDGSLGLKEFAPYDRILVTAGAPKIPEALIGQLADGGRMVIPVGSEFNQTLTLVKKEGSRIKTDTICGCVFVPLVGKNGWPGMRGDLH